jgi:predicted transcriptional regulator
VTKKSRDESKLLTETELELMTILWKLGEGSVNDVLAELPQGRDLAYTSVSTILRILEQKKNPLEPQRGERARLHPVGEKRSVRSREPSASGE